MLGFEWGLFGGIADSMLAILNKYPELKLVDCDYEAAKPDSTAVVPRGYRVGTHTQ